VIESGILQQGTNTIVIKRASGGDNFLIGNVVVHWRESDGPVSEKPGVRAFPTHSPERPMVPSEAPHGAAQGKAPPWGCTAPWGGFARERGPTGSPLLKQRSATRVPSGESLHSSYSDRH
jgi:hypothetical protein